MKKLVCNLIIMGALAISTHSQAQHLLLEALDAPDWITDDLGRPYPGNPGGGTGGSRDQCIAQGLHWNEGSSLYGIFDGSRGCYCTPRSIGDPKAKAIWEVSTNYPNGRWVCGQAYNPPNDIGIRPPDDDCGRVAECNRRALVN